MRCVIWGKDSSYENQVFVPLVQPSTCKSIVCVSHTDAASLRSIKFTQSRFLLQDYFLKRRRICDFVKISETLDSALEPESSVDNKHTINNLGIYVNKYN